MTLPKRYSVTACDREQGGHSPNVTIDYDGTRLAVDVRFIVHNELNCADLTALLLAKRSAAPPHRAAIRERMVMMLCHPRLHPLSSYFR